MAATTVPNAFALFPNELARNRDVSEPLLVFLAHRATFIGSYVSREQRLATIVSRGMGKNVARRVMSEAQKLGLLERKQKNRDGRFGALHETLRLPPCGASGRAGRIVYRAWFDGSLTVDEMAALLFLRAGSDKGRAYPRELAERFGWSEPRAGKVIASLERRGLVVRVKGARAANGRYQGSAYTVPRLSRKGLRRSEHGSSAAGDHIESAGNGSAGNGKAGNIHTLNPSYSLPSEELPKHTNGHCTASASRQQMTCDSSDDAEGEAWASPKLLAWIGEDTRSEFLDTDEVASQILDDVTANWGSRRVAQLPGVDRAPDSRRGILWHSRRVLVRRRRVPAISERFVSECTACSSSRCDSYGSGTRLPP
jgi:hypothetical protein